MALWELMHLGTLCMVTHCWYEWTKVFGFLVFKGGSKCYLPQKGESEKLKQRGGIMVQGQVFLKWRGCNFSYLIFSRFIIFTFRNFSLQNCFMHLKNNNFLLLPQFYEKSHSKLSRNEHENIP